MATEIKVPSAGRERDHGDRRPLDPKKAGEAVAADEPVVELETDKVTVEVNAPSAGTLSISAQEGAEVEVGALLGGVDAAGAGGRRARGSARHARLVVVAGEGAGRPPGSRLPGSRPRRRARPRA